MLFDGIEAKLVDTAVVVAVALVNELTAVLRLAIRFGNLGGGSEVGTAGGGGGDNDVNSNS